MKKLLLAFFTASLFFISNTSFAQTFKYQCGEHKLTVMLSPNAAYLDGKPYTYKHGETDGAVTKLTFYGDSNVLKFLADPASNNYKLGLTSNSSYEEKDCQETQ